MNVIIKNTTRDLLKVKRVIYVLFFGTLFFIISYGINFSITKGGANPQDFSAYGKLVTLHIFLYLFYVILAIVTTNDLSDDIENGFIEIYLLSVSRKRYFFSKYLAYVFNYTLILISIGIIGLIACKLFLKINSVEIKILLAFLALGVNIAFMLLLVMLLVIKHNLKAASLSSILIFVIISILNSETIASTIFRSKVLGKIISTGLPSILKIQNEFIRFGTGFGFSENCWMHFLNIFIYFIILFTVLSYLVKKYECKA